MRYQEHLTDDDIKLVEMAKVARGNAHAPYSGFSVGAAIRTREGKIYQGCNVEMFLPSLTVCAERVALCNAICSGARDFEAIAVIGDSEGPCTPCGLCRQALIDFNPEMRVIMTNLAGDVLIRTAKALLPDAFGAKQIPARSHRSHEQGS